MHEAFSISYLGPAVYVLRQRQGLEGGEMVLYVGMSAGNWPARIGAHRNKPWGCWISEVEVHPCKDAYAASRLEAKLIRKFRPPYNSALNFDD